MRRNFPDRLRGLAGRGAALLPAFLLALLAAGMSLTSERADGADGAHGTDRRARPAERWTADEMAVLASLRLATLPPLPADPSNAVEDSAAAAELGRRLFNDPRFSRNQAVSCASCHDPALQFQDGRPVGQGVGVGVRRSMPIVGAGHARWLFWDGRKDSTWAQVLGPLEDAVEHGGNRVRHVQLLKAHYRKDYEAVFGPMPDLAGLPEDASPIGSPAEQAAWGAMAPALRETASRIFANLGKAIAAYEKTLGHGPSRFDRYLEQLLAPPLRSMPPPTPADGTPGELTPQEVNGLRIFIGKGQCVTCHNGPLFSDQQFHNTGVPPRDPARPDRGRALGARLVQRDEFNCLGRFSDAKPDDCQELRFIVDDDPGLEGAFRTPSLRNVALRPPYMHAGQLATLGDVIAHYVQSPPAAVGHSELRHAQGRGERRRIRLDEAEARDLAAFLATLSGPIVDREGASQRLTNKVTSGESPTWALR